MSTWYEQPATGSVDEKGNRTYHRKWKVQLADNNVQPPLTWADIGITRLVSTWPTDAQATARTLDDSPLGDEQDWREVTVMYSSAPFDVGNSSQDPTEQDQSTSPPDRPWKITYGSEHGTRILGPKDLNNVAVCNAAGQPFDPPIEIPCSMLQIHISAYKGIATFDPIAKKLTYEDSINDAALLLAVTPTATTTFPAKTLRCTEYICESYSENGANYWQVNITLVYRKVAWNPVEALNAGTCYIKSASLPPQPILDEHGQQITHPIPLAADGTVLNAGNALNYLSFKGYEEQNFAALLA